MGKYDNEYRHYYRRVSDEPKQEEETLDNINKYDEDFIYGQRKKKKEENHRKNFFYGLIGTSIVSISIFSLVVGSKYFLGEKGEAFYNRAKLALEKDNFNFAELGLENLVKKNKEEGQSETNSEKENKENDMSVGSFKLNENTVENTGDNKEIASIEKAIIPIDNYKEMKKFQSAVKFVEAEGTVIASLDGEVVNINKDPENYFIQIDNKDGLKIFYYNCDDFMVKKGDKIKQGEKIARVEKTDNFMIKIEENDGFLSSEKYFKVEKTANN
ncbi:MAG: M23 family metallopeptidase [Sarcina sp.]